MAAMIGAAAGASGALASAIAIVGVPATLRAMPNGSGMPASRARTPARRGSRYGRNVGPASSGAISTR